MKKSNYLLAVAMLFIAGTAFSQSPIAKGQDVLTKGLDILEGVIVDEINLTRNNDI